MKILYLLQNILVKTVYAADDPFATIFGKPTINVPGGLSPDASGGVGNTLGHLIGVSIRLFLIFAGFTALIYLLWGAYDYVSSSGESKYIESAQKKITYASIGLILIIVALVVFQLIAGNILGILGPGFSILIPRL